VLCPVEWAKYGWIVVGDKHMTNLVLITNYKLLRDIKLQYKKLKYLEGNKTPQRSSNIIALAYYFVNFLDRGGDILQTEVRRINMR
jgi:hypothetical protein